MSRSFTIALAILTILALTGEAAAQVKVGLGAQLTYAVSETGAGLPASMIHGGHTVTPIAPGWALFGEVGFSTPLAKLAPAPQMAFGVVQLLENGLSLSALGLYRWNPSSYAGPLAGTHVLGVLLAPGTKIGEGTTLLLPIGVVHNATLDKSIFLIGFRLNFHLVTL